MATFTIVEAAQRSPEWFAARVGRLTGSRANDMLATIKSGEAAARRDLRIQLVLERLTGEPQESGYVSADMQRGIDKEPEACAAYEDETGLTVRHTGFLTHPDLMVGCSLDGDIDNFTGIVELKCPKSATHYSYWKAGGLPAVHKPQVLHNLWLTGAAWCDFVSYDDRFPAHLRLFRVRVARNEFELMAYERTVKAFLAEVQREYDEALTLMETAWERRSLYDGARACARDAGGDSGDRPSA